MNDTAPRIGIVEERAPIVGEPTCASCRANCCRLEVPLIGDAGVPAEYVEVDARGAMTMARLDDGWCAALDRATLRCGIYDDRPLVCREFEMGGWECLAERG